MPSSEAVAATPDEVLEITRVFEAPRDLLFRLWADPAHRVRWWGPEGYGLSECAVDFQEGGAWSVGMQNVEGYVHRVHGVFTEIVEPQRLAFTYINDNDGLEMTVVMDFIDLGTATEMRFRQSRFATVEARDEHGWGWRSTLDLLAGYVIEIIKAGPMPVGRPRIDGVAADIITARERLERDKHAKAESKAKGEQ
jgi:uncharacterized protein YndB with AHSA1/START domain